MIIGLLGQAGVGKDTAADYLVKKHGFAKVALADPLKRICREVFDFTEDQLWGPSASRNAPDERYPKEHAWRYEARSVLLSACARCGVLKENAVNKPCFLTPRYALQQLGTEWGRDCYGDVWVEYALRIAKRLMAYDRDNPNMVNYYSARSGLIFVGGRDKPKGVVISDVRFKNEVAALKKIGAKVVRIRRPAVGLEGGAAQHLSEREQKEIHDDDLDAVIHNDDSFEVLHTRIERALTRLRG